jgi:hypothetical protein
MTERTARTVANVVIGAAAVGAAYIVVRTPSLRRLAIGLAMTGLTRGLPAWVTREAQHAWSQSARRAI